MGHGYVPAWCGCCRCGWVTLGSRERGRWVVLCVMCPARVLHGRLSFWDVVGDVVLAYYCAILMDRFVAGHATHS